MGKVGKYHRTGVLNRKVVSRKLGLLLSGRRAQGILAACLLAVAVIVLTMTFSPPGEKAQVYAAGSRTGLPSSWEEDSEYSCLPAGLAGLACGLERASRRDIRLARMGTSAENVMVGQRVRTASESYPILDLSGAVSSTVTSLHDRVSLDSVQARIMSDEDYINLCRIVEAEAGTEDIKGRVLVANVIMNRVRHDEFPDTVSEVIFHYNDGIPQFSPVYDGSIYNVTVTDETREAVRQVMEGRDDSEGALFFIQRDAAEKHNVRWFDKDLKRLFKHGVHEFYKYPEETK